ncbi:chitin binding Peritrophin-A domain protein, partial [Teladorsagia circumcincta]
DLVYNDLTKRCLQKEDIPACKPFDREAARQNFDCSTKVDGYYEKERCQPYFYSCVAGRTEVLECTTGLVFDARISACDYPLACKSPLATAVTSPNPAADHGSINDGLCLSGVAFSMNCPAGLVFNEANGYCDYLESCLRSPSVVPAVANSASSISYGKCVNGTAITMSCPAGLVFNELGGYCDYPANCPWYQL